MVKRYIQKVVIKFIIYRDKTQDNVKRKSSTSL